MFKVGDKIKCINAEGSSYILEQDKVYIVLSTMRHYVKVYGSSDSWDPTRFVLASWVPQPGELIEVRDSEDYPWLKREFVAFDTKRGNNIIIRSAVCRDRFWSYHDYRQTVPTHTLTLDGKTIEVSEECYQSIQALLDDA